MNSGGSGVRLAEFAGDWLLTRRIEDRRGPGGQLDGRASFVVAAVGLDYHEAGLLQLGSAAAVRAERRYRWREEAGRIVVTFADGQAFHDFDPAEPQSEAEHHCPPDFYKVRYDFISWPEWSTEWQVRGPRKDYRMLSRFRRA